MRQNDSDLLRGISRALLAAILLMSQAACVTPQVQVSTQVLALNLTANDFKQSGLAFLTPSSFTGQEEDKQSMALSFHDVMQKARPGMRIVSLPVTLTAVNRAGLAGEYRRMLEDYRLTGLLDRDVLIKVGKLADVRYLAQLKLAGFRQESKDRWGTMGIRILQTKSTVVRLYLQIWDASDGSIAWEGSTELTMAHDGVREGPVTFRNIIEEAARQLVAQVP